MSDAEYYLIGLYLFVFLVHFVVFLVSSFLESCGFIEFVVLYYENAVSWTVTALTLVMPIFVYLLAREGTSTEAKLQQIKQKVLRRGK